MLEVQVYVIVQSASYIIRFYSHLYTNKKHALWNVYLPNTFASNIQVAMNGIIFYWQYDGELGIYNYANISNGLFMPTFVTTFFARQYRFFLVLKIV